MNITNCVNLNIFALTISKQDLAKVVACCTYGLRESVTLINSLEKLGFNNIDTQSVQDISSDDDLTLLATFCLDRLIAEKNYETVRESLDIKVGDKVWHDEFLLSFVALIDRRVFKKTGNPNDLWLELKICCGEYGGQYFVGSVRILRDLGWVIGGIQ